MKITIKVKVLTQGCMPEISEKGDWIDLKSAIDMNIPAPQSGILKRKVVNGVEINHRDVTMETIYVPLGVAMELPKGFEAVVDSRSSTPKKAHLFIPNGQGVIDNSFNGNYDQWHFVCSPMKETTIEKGQRICQFRIQLSQKATVLQKIKWLLSSGIELVEVDNLNEESRGGLGSTGK